MAAVTGRAQEYGVAFRNHKELKLRVDTLREQLMTEEENLRKADQKLNSAKRTLLEEAQLS